MNSVISNNSAQAIEKYKFGNNVKAIVNHSNPPPNDNYLIAAKQIVMTYNNNQ